MFDLHTPLQHKSEPLVCAVGVNGVDQTYEMNLPQYHAMCMRADCRYYRFVDPHFCDNNLPLMKEEDKRECLRSKWAHALFELLF